MDLKKDLVALLDTEFERAKESYMFWTGILTREGFNVDNAILAAQYYGQMCEIVNIERELLGEHRFAKEFDKVIFNLYEMAEKDKNES